MLDNGNNGFGRRGKVSTIDGGVAGRAAYERSTVNPEERKKKDEHTTIRDNGMESKPKEGGGVATRPNGVGDINNHVQAVFGRGT